MKIMRISVLILIWTLSTTMVKANDSWLKDTIYVQYDETIGKYAIHKVEKKQTLFSLANAYGLDLYDVYDFNPILKSRILMADDVLKMPISPNHITMDPENLDQNKKRRPVVYIAKPKDNLYKIAKTYFNLSFEGVMQLNNMTSPEIKVNQRIVLGYFDNTKKETEAVAMIKPNTVKAEQINLEEKFTKINPAPFTEEYKAIDFVTTDWIRKYGDEENSSEKIINLENPLKEIKIKERKEEKAASAKTPEKTDGKPTEKITTSVSRSLDNPNVADTKARVIKRRMVTQNGVAQWVKTENTTSDLYVLHPTAPVNSVVEITNPMTHRKIYAKVLSNMPPKLYSEDITVVVSPGVANLLGVIDSRFYVKLRYVEETIQ